MSDRTTPRAAHRSPPPRRFRRTSFVVSLAVITLGLASGTALALITGAAGNKPVTDPGWPSGAAKIFNHPSRIAWWEGPPFGGGEWHAEYRGDAKALNPLLADFAALELKNKRVVVHDGIGQSFWLNMNREPAKRDAAKMDWSFTVWQPGSWERLRRMPADLNPTDPRDADKGPPSRFDIYTGGPLRWADVTVPKGLEIDDQRLEAHGFSAADGTVIEGTVADLATKAPIASAKVRLERIEPQQKGGYRYSPPAQAIADARGRWVLKNVPAGWYQLVADADNYVPHVFGYAQPDGQPRWQSYETGLARPATVSGLVKDASGKPLEGVEVTLMNVEAENQRYKMPEEPSAKTDAEGRFRIAGAPAGRASVWVRKEGYLRPGLGLAIATPRDGIDLTMIRSAALRVTVDFGGKNPPPEYLIDLTPEKGATIESYGGSSRIDAQNQATYKSVPPGRYVIVGHPNPSSDSEKTEPQTIILKGGETTEATLQAK